MSKIGTVLNEEIVRLSRKECRQQIEPIKKTTTQMRHEVVALKRQVVQLERQVAILSRKVLERHRRRSRLTQIRRPRAFPRKDSRHSALGSTCQRPISGSSWASVPSRSTTGNPRRHVRGLSRLQNWLHCAGWGRGRLRHGWSNWPAQSTRPGGRKRKRIQGWSNTGSATATIVDRLCLTVCTIRTCQTGGAN